MIRILNTNGVILNTKDKYCTNNIEVAVDPTNIVPENIVKGKAILGVTGTYEGSIPEGYIKPEGTIKITKNGIHDITSYATAEVNVEDSGGVDYLAQYINGTMTKYKSDILTSIPDNFFSTYQQPNLTIIDAPLTTFYSKSFIGLKLLSNLVLRNNSVPTLSSTDYITSGTSIPTDSFLDGYIFVKDDLVDSYKSATNWSSFSSKIFPVSAYDQSLIPTFSYEKIIGGTLDYGVDYITMYSLTPSSSSVGYCLAKISFNVPEGGYNTIKINASVVNRGTVLLSDLDTTLNSNNKVDTENVVFSSSNTSFGKTIHEFKNVSAGNHFVYIKYILSSTFYGIAFVARV